MKKVFAFLLAFLLIFSLIGCKEDAVLGEVKTHPVDSSIHSLNIQINAADFKIVPAEDFSVESNLKYLTVSEEDGVLSIVENAHSGATYANAMLTLYVPKDIIFESVSITTGAAKLTADALIAQRLKLQLGAGDVHIGQLVASSQADIQGGAGKITVDRGSFTNLKLEMGVGELNLVTKLLGVCDLTLGVGESNLTFLGSKDDYCINIEKGLGSIFVDGALLDELDGSGLGLHRINIQCGVGATNITFQ